MTQTISVIDRISQQVITEDVWGEPWLRFLYGTSPLAKTLGRALLHSMVRWPFVSWLTGLYYDTSFSRRSIQPFCDRFHIDMTESVLQVNEFLSFNDFFSRHLTKKSRPQTQDALTLTVPADGRYRFLHDLGTNRSFHIKGELFSLPQLIGSTSMAAQFYGGSGVICRLSPTDCHRFYFPTTGKAKESIWINGSLFSVSPIATTSFPWIFWHNRRVVTLLESDLFGTIAYVEIGATNCGSISETFVPHSWVRKGEEKGYFKLGGSAIVLLFEPGRIQFAEDLLELSKTDLEVLCKTGQPLGTRQQ